MKLLKKGFTIIELLVVIAIAGILVSIGGAKLIGNVRKATVAKLQHNLGISRESLKVASYKDLNFPNLFTVSTETLEKYYIFPTPEFTSKDGIKYEESSNIVTIRTNTGGWIYSMETGSLYANLPNGAYTKDSNYEIWSGESSSGSIDSFGGNSGGSTNNNNGDNNNNDSENNTTSPSVDWGNSTLVPSYIVGAGGIVYKNPENPNELVVDINPNVGWVDNFVKGASLTGNYFVYIDDKLVNQGTTQTSSSGQAINSINSYKQKVESSDSKNIKVAFEYLDESGTLKMLYGEVPLVNNN